MSFRLEVWDRKADRRRAIFGTLYAAERRRVLQAEEMLAAEVAVQDGATSALTAGAVLRLQREGSAPDFSLWRLMGREQVRGADGRLVLRITADALWMDLRHGLVRQRLVDGRSQYTFGLTGLTPEQWLQDFILPAYEGDATGFQLGVVELAEPVDLSFERSSPLEALRMLEGAAEGEAQFRLDPSGEFYHVDFLARLGATQGTAELRFGKNLAGLERLEDETDVETRLYAVGAGLLTLADAEWRIGSLSGSTGAREITFSGPSPVFEDSAFVGQWLRVPAKGAYPITASDHEAGTVRVDGTGLPALSVGDVGHLVTDTEGSRLDYLQSPAGRDSYGVRVGTLTADDVPDALNLIPNPDVAEWSGGLPVGWTRLGTPTVSQETGRDYVQHGERSARVVAAEDGEGLLSPAFELLQPADRPYTAMLAGLTLISGQARVELRHQDGTVYPIAQRPILVERDIYTEMKAGPVHDEPLPPGTYQLAVVAHGEASEWVLDCAMVTPVIGNEVPAYVTGSGAHRLWERAAAELEDRRLPRLEYRVEVVDLFRADPEAFRFDELRLGDDVKLRDPEFPLETVRIVELTEDILDAAATQVALAPSARQRVVDPFRPPPPPLGGRLPGPGQRPGSTGAPSVLHVMRQGDGAAHELTLGALGSPNVATLELRTKTSPADPWPSAPLATIVGRQGWFDSPVSVPGESTVYYQVLPRDGRGVAGEPVEDSWSVALDAERPTAAIELASETATHETLRFLGQPGAGGRAPLAYQYAVEGVAGWSAWAPMPDGEIITDGQAGRPSPIARSERTRTVLLRVRDADGRESQVASYALSSEAPTAVPDTHLTLIQARWTHAPVGSPDDQSLELEVEFSDQVARLEILYGPYEGDPAPFDPVQGHYFLDVSGGDGHRLHRLRDSNEDPPATDPTTVAVWPPEYPMSTLVRIWARNEAGNRIAERRIVVSDDPAPVVSGGTGKSELPAGHLVLGAGREPVHTLAGSAAGNLVKWDELDAAWKAEPAFFDDLPSIPGGTLYGRAPGEAGPPGPLAFEALPFDNYGSWAIAVGGDTSGDAVGSTEVVRLYGTGGVSVERTGTREITLSLAGGPPPTTLAGLDDTAITAPAPNETQVLVRPAGMTTWIDADLATAGISEVGHTHAVATTSAAGFMSAADKAKLNGIASGADNYGSWAIAVGGDTSGDAVSSTETVRLYGTGGVRVERTGTREVTFSLTGGPPPTTLAGLDDTSVSTSPPSQTQVLVRHAGMDTWADQTLAQAGISPAGHTHDDRYLRLIGGTVTGPIELRGPTNEDTDLLRFGDRAAGYGFWWRYAGVGTGTSNLLELWTDNQTDAPLRALSVNQDGVVNVDGVLQEGGARVATRTWASGQFDNYDSWQIAVGTGASGDSVGPGETVHLTRSGGIQLTRTGPRTINIHADQAASYTWWAGADSGSNRQITSGDHVEFAGGSGINTHVSDMAPGHRVTISLSESYLPLSGGTLTGQVWGQQINAQRPDPTNWAITVRTQGDSSPRWFVEAGGRMRWYDGVSSTLAMLWAEGGLLVSSVGLRGPRFVKDSSRRWKTSIRDWAAEPDDLRTLRPVEYDLIPERGGAHDYGFIAEEVPAWAATEERDGIEYDRITTALVAGWQAHDGEIQALRREVAELRDRLAAVEG